MRNLEILRFFSLAFIWFLSSSGMPDDLPAKDPPVRAYFADVGQGDAFLLRTPSGKAYLYDIGNQEHKLAAFLALAGVDSLEAVLISHPDLDHFGAFPALQGIPVKKWYLPETNSPDPAWSRLVRVLDASAASLDTLYAGDTLAWADGVKVDALWPPRHYPGSDNDRSLVLRIACGNSGILLTGDVEADAEAALLASGRSLGSGILKVAHHGSRTSSALPLLASISPRWAVISCDSSVYGHPHPETLAGLGVFIREEGHILRTDREGTVLFEIDADGVRRLELEKAN